MALASCICFELSLVHWIVCVCYVEQRIYFSIGFTRNENRFQGRLSPFNHGFLTSKTILEGKYVSVFEYKFLLWIDNPFNGSLKPIQQCYSAAIQHPLGGNYSILAAKEVTCNQPVIVSH